MSIATRYETITGVRIGDQLPVFLLALGHGSAHWLGSAFYMLLPWIREDLGINYLVAGSLVAVTHLSSLLANFGSGALTDVTGRRVLILCLSLVLGTLALVGISLINHPFELAILIAIVGATGHIWHPAAISLLSGLYPEKRGFALSVHSLGASMGDALAPVTLGLMLSVMVWQTAVVITGLPVFGVVILLWYYLGRSEKSRDDPSLHNGWQGYLANLKLLCRSKALFLLSLMSAFHGAAQTGLMMFVPIYLADHLGAGPMITGFGFASLQIGGIFVAPLTGLLSDRIGRKPIVLCALAGSAVMTWLLAFAESEALFIPCVLLLGCLLFALRPVEHSWCMDLAPEKMAGTAIGILFGVSSIFALATPILTGAVADNWEISKVFWMLAVLIVVSGLLAFFIPTKKPGKTSD